MDLHIIWIQNIHHDEVQREMKTSREEIAEDLDLVRFGRSRRLTFWRGSAATLLNHPQSLQTCNHPFGHLALTKDGGQLRSI